jgi:hypothetical protein
MLRYRKNHTKGRKLSRGHWCAFHDIKFSRATIFLILLSTGCGTADGQQTLALAIHNAKKFAVSDGIKRFEASPLISNLFYLTITYYSYL